jgi:hypothetical protein
MSKVLSGAEPRRGPALDERKYGKSTGADAHQEHSPSHSLLGRNPTLRHESGASGRPLPPPSVGRPSPLAPPAAAAAPIAGPGDAAAHPWPPCRAVCDACRRRGPSWGRCDPNEAGSRARRTQVAAARRPHRLGEQKSSRRLRGLSPEVRTADGCSSGTQEPRIAKCFVTMLSLCAISQNSQQQQIHFFVSYK